MYHVLWQTADEKEELEPWLVKEMDELLSVIWLTGNEDCFSQLIHLIKSENVSGLTGYDNMTSMNIPYQFLIQKKFICIRYYVYLEYCKVEYLMLYIQWTTSTLRPACPPWW